MFRYKIMDKKIFQKYKIASNSARKVIENFLFSMPWAVISRWKGRKFG